MNVYCKIKCRPRKVLKFKVAILSTIKSKRNLNFPPVQNSSHFDLPSFSYEFCFAVSISSFQNFIKLNTALYVVTESLINKKRETKLELSFITKIKINLCREHVFLYKLFLLFDFFFRKTFLIIFSLRFFSSKKKLLYFFLLF